MAVLACGPSPAALEEQARTVADDASAPAPERARAHRKLGRILLRQGQLREAKTRLEAAAELFDADPAELTPTLNDLSDVLFWLGELERLEDVLWRALDAAALTGDRRSAADSWNNLGVSFAARGRPSAALAAYHRCLELHSGLDNAHGVAVMRHNLGVQLLLLGRVDEGVEELEQALESRRLLDDSVGVGQTGASLAWSLTLDGRREEGLDAFSAAIELLEQGEAVHDLAIALEQRAQLHRLLGRPEDARDDLRRSLDLLEPSGGATPLDAAYLHLGLGAVQQEPVLLRQAVESFDALDAHEGRILARLELARALRGREGSRDEAVRLLEDAIEIVETARSDLRLPSFRATFLGGWQAVYQELVDVLASAAVASDESDESDESDVRTLTARALAMAERARARSLLDRMAAAPDTDPSSGDSEPWQGLRGKVEELEAQALFEPAEDRDAGGEDRGSTPSADKTRTELRRARFALERTREVSRRGGAPSPAATTADLDAIRRYLDADTVLLIYSLGARRSWLWRLDVQSLAVIPLPPGPEIDAAARHVHQLLPLHDRPGYRGAARESLARLAQQVLGPVQDLGPGRLAIVPDGALHLVPFGALPGTEDYEVVHLPSASTLVELRRRADRASASRLLAVVADPVFEADDPRLAGAEAAVPEDGPDLARTRRALSGRLGRLPAAAQEGTRIAEIARRSSGVEPPVHSGFDASRELVTGGGLGDFRILHFATHGVADAEDPALAGLVLSLYDDAGQRRDGLLRARDLHDLRLSADLVVLSACRTALGQEVRGEGLVGLADGFFAAGARHLVVSLWDVDDRATAELMVRFYRHLLLDGRRPADALRRAQRELREETEWRSPSFWAAFVAVGDWHVPFTPKGVTSNSPG